MLQVDPMTENFSNMNPYNGMFNNPIRGIDPTGMVTTFVDSNGVEIGNDGVDNGLVVETTKEEVAENTDDDGNTDWDAIRNNEDNGSWIADQEKYNDYVMSNIGFLKERFDYRIFTWDQRGNITGKDSFFDGGAVFFLATSFSGAKGLGYGFSLFKSGLKRHIIRRNSFYNKGNWWRLGQGWNPNIGAKNIRAAWGAHPKHLNSVPSYLQGFNKWLRSLGNGHKHFPKW